MRHFRIISPQLSRNSKFATQNPNIKSQAVSKSDLSGYLRPKLDSSRTVPIVRSLNHWNFAREYNSLAQEPKEPPSERVSAIVDEISGLSLLEIADLVGIMRKKLDVNGMPAMAVMMPGMGLSVRSAGAKVAKVAGAPKGEEKKAEKTAFDLKLEGFDAASKIKVIKEVRSFTDLGLKEAKDLVEKAPTLLKKGVTKEEATKIIEKMKEIGAKVTMD